ncbi:hypothetical protein HUJ05_000156 [Dendroctonus ponderosae]|nr:hypothetical protein HUJ05_000156 [Dendroctonus ponderosae]
MDLSTGIGHLNQENQAAGNCSDEDSLLDGILDLSGLDLDNEETWITPVVLMFFLYSVYLSKHVGNGPIFPLVYDTFNNPCKKHWWAVFLYIQNYYNRDEICWVHLWYLSADWQLFLAAPLVLIPMAWLLKRGFKLVFTVMAILNVFFVLLAIFVKLVFPNFDPEHLEYDAHSKLVTYFMGAMFGICLRCHLNKPYVFRRGCNLIMWAISLSMLFAATLVLHEVNINHIESHTVKSITDVLIKPFWALGLAFVIYACTSGYGGIVNWLLTAGWMQVLSKLTFCMYITHMPVIFLWISIRRTRDHFTDFTLVRNIYAPSCARTIIISVIWTLMFESPLITIERVLLGGGKKPKSSPKEDIPKGKIVILHQKPIENGYI